MPIDAALARPTTQAQSAWHAFAPAVTKYGVLRLLHAEVVNSCANPEHQLLPLTTNRRLIAPVRCFVDVPHRNTTTPSIGARLEDAVTAAMSFPGSSRAAAPSTECAPLLPHLSRGRGSSPSHTSQFLLPHPPIPRSVVVVNFTQTRCLPTPPTVARSFRSAFPNSPAPTQAVHRCSTRALS